jgi:signal transduction histidine kinase
LRFETLLANLSATFINLPTSQVDSQIEAALKHLVEFLDVDRGGLAEIIADEKQLIITHSYHVPGVPLLPRIILSEQLPWYARTIQRGEVFRISQLPDELPPEAMLERAYCLRTGLRSHVMIPLKVMDAVVGAIGFGSFRQNRDWPDDLIQRLRLVGEIFINALARKRADQALKKAEEQSRILRDELAHATRLELVSHLTISIAHEVNQPLCAIASNAQTAIELLGMGETEEVTHALHDIWSDAKRGSEVIGRVRNMVRKEESSRLTTALASVIEEIAPLLRREAAAKGVTLKLALQSNDPTVVCDRVQLQQVVFNLLLNAVEAVSQASVGPPSVEIRLWAEDPNSAHVLVADSGVGLSETDHERVFAPFFTTKANGLGMGLAISRSIIEDHGGKIWATRGPGHGTVFHFRLPSISGTR